MVERRHGKAKIVGPIPTSGSMIGGFLMPETIFVDSGGHIVFHKRGPMTLEEMRETVKKYLP